MSATWAPLSRRWTASSSSPNRCRRCRSASSATTTVHACAEEYFSARPGIWTHGDLLQFTRTGGLIVSGRSDATLNRGGVRIGTSEVYRVVEALPGVTDSLIVHHEDGDRLVLFVAMDDASSRRDIADEAP
ncbi:MAG: hypothetical protein R2697_20080 [Ilumatobacteraceae bacterium]